MRTDSIFEAIGDTPLVELTELSPRDGARVFVKVEGENPTGSMKDRMALAMIERAEQEGLLSQGQRVVENTSGSTGSSLAMVCSVKGYPISLVSADCYAAEKLATMRALGADLEVLETPDGEVYPDLSEEMQARSSEIRAETGAYYTNQLENEHQLDGYRTLGEEILRDCPEITDFVACVGSGGLAMGASSAFRDQDTDVHVTLVEPTESPVLSDGKTGEHGIEGVAGNEPVPLLDAALYDEILATPEARAQRYARRLATEEGIFAGASAGLNVASAVSVAENRSSDAAVVTVACDTGLKYLQGSLYRDSS